MNNSPSDQNMSDDKNQDQFEEKELNALTETPTSKPEEVKPEKQDQPETKVQDNYIHKPENTNNFQRNTKDSSIHDIFGNRSDEGFYPSKTKTIGESHIEVQQYDIPTKKADDNDQEKESDNHDAVLPKTKNNFPIISHNNSSRLVGICTSLSVIVLVLGFGGGFLGYKYWPNLANKATVSADTETVTTTAPKTISKNTPNPSPSPTISINSTSEDPLKNWSNYANKKFNYTLKYPDTWFSGDANNDQASTIQFTSFKPTTGGSEIQSGYKVEVTFQGSNNKLLKDWIKDNNIVAGYGTPEQTALKIDGKDAYQQTVDSNGKSINTYVFQADKVMVISYYAPEKDFEIGKKIYSDIINSIKLLWKWNLAPVESSTVK